MSLFLQLAIFATLILLLCRMEAIWSRLDAIDRHIAQRRRGPERHGTLAGAVARPQPGPGSEENGTEERAHGGRDRIVPGAARTTSPDAVIVAAEPGSARAVPLETEASVTTPPPISVSVRPAPDVVPQRPRVDIELRFGRRWAALLGGGLIAFGLALLVRHSFQQGYFPPAVRLAGAALLSFALCGSAEIFRRRGTFTALPGTGLARRAADIPSILLGTGLGGLFAVTYAAHAAYGYFGIGLAFAVMVAVALSGIAASLAYGPALAVLGYLAAQGVPLLVGDAGTAAGASYVALVGVAGYTAAHLGRWRRLENPAGAILLLWTGLMMGKSLLDLALVALPASAAAFAFTVLRLRPRAAWTDWRQSPQACIALVLMAGHGLLLSFHSAGAPPLSLYEPTATALGLAVLLAAFAFCATATRARAAAPLLAAAVVVAVTILSARVAGSPWPQGGSVVGLVPSQVAINFALASAVVLAVAAAALHRGSRRSPLTGLAGTASAAILLAASDLVLHLMSGLDREILASVAVAQGVTLVAAARPRGGVLPPARHFATAAAASVGVGLLGFALVVSGFGDGPSTTLVLALTGAGAGALAWAWALPLFASVAGIAAVPVLLRAGVAVVDNAIATEQSGTALRPLLETTLLPGLVLTGTALLLRRRPGVDAVREADRRWLTLIGAAALPSGAGRQAVSLVLAGAAAGGLLLGALVGTVRFIAYGDPYAPLSSPSDLGLACTLALSGSLAALRLHRATSVEALRWAARALAVTALPLSGAALLANPFVTGVSMGELPLLNLLVLAYLLPALAAWRLAREDRATTDHRWRTLASAMAIAGFLGYATFAVAQVFEGPVLSLARITEAELWTYTAAWLAMGAAVLAYGLRLRARAIRVAGLGIIAGAAAKVVVVDLSALSGTALAASVLALGLVLLGVGMAYQRLTAAIERS